MSEPVSLGRHSPLQQFLRITFALDHRGPADEIDVRMFAPDASEDAVEFHARGLFSGGVSIADRLLKYEGTPVQRSELTRGNVRCVPVRVHFVDGSTWTASPANDEHTTPT